MPNRMAADLHIPSSWAKCRAFFSGSPSTSIASPESLRALYSVMGWGFRANPIQGFFKVESPVGGRLQSMSLYCLLSWSLKLRIYWVRSCNNPITNQLSSCILPPN